MALLVLPALKLTAQVKLCFKLNHSHFHSQLFTDEAQNVLYVMLCMQVYKDADQTPAGALT